MDKNYIPSLDEIVDWCCTFRPGNVADRTDAAFCTPGICATHVFDQVRNGGTVLPLAHDRQGRYGAGYVRVSSMRQQEDGFSIPDQIKRVAAHFIEKRQAFRIYSDAALPGTLPTRDPYLQQTLINLKADLYEDTFRRVLLSSAGHKYTADDLAGMHRFLEDAVCRMRAGIAGQTEATDLAGPTDSSAEERLALNLDGYDLMLPRRLGSKAVHRRNRYRPGLTCLMDDVEARRVHTVALTDLSRFSRSHLLFSVLATKLQARNVTVEGIVEDLSWMARRNDLGAAIIAQVLPILAEYRVRELMLSSLRGIITRLETGQPHATIPSWLQWDEQAGRVVFRRDPRSGKSFEATIRMMAELYVDETGGNRASFLPYNCNGYGTVASKLNTAGLLNPRGKPWTPRTVADILQNPALAGYQWMFGKLWSVFPPVVEPAVFERIQRTKRARTLQKNGRPAASAGGYMLTGLLKCRCGSAITFRPTNDKVPALQCNMAPSLRRELAKTEPNLRHTVLNRPDIEQFFNQLMEENPDLVLTPFRQDEQQQRIEKEIEHLEEQKQRLERERLRVKRELEEKSDSHLRQLSFAPTNPAYMTMRAALVEGWQAERNETEHLRKVQAQIDAHRHSLEGFLGQDEFQDIKERARNWRALLPAEKNAILRALFAPFRVCGEPPNEYLSGSLRAPTPIPLAPIPLVTRASRSTGKVKYTRRMPSLGAWIKQLANAAHK